MQEEMDTLEQNDTLELVHLPPGAKTMGSKWIFNVKFQVDGSIEQYKARLVTKDFNQSPNKDYNATFALTAKLTIVRLLISLATSNFWPLHQLHVKNTFLNGNLDKTIYMDPPLGFRANRSILGKFVVY